MRFAEHHGQAAPCAPGRASLYTGTYQMNHRVVTNGSPLDDRFDNVARLARRAGNTPVLFGYTDQALDPRLATGPGDPRLFTYEGVLSGFEVGLDLTGEMVEWQRWLTGLGHEVGGTIHEILGSEPTRPAEHSVSAFLTDRVIEWIGTHDEPWFLHASYLRPHPPYAAAGQWTEAVDPGAVDLPIPPPATRLHRFHEMALGHADAAAPTDETEIRALRAQYYGMIGEVDAQVGRLFDALRACGRWDDTVVVVTADHGELLGDHGLVGKLGWWRESFHIPCIIRDPGHPIAHGSVVEALTESVDVLATLAELLDQPVPMQSDGLPLTTFLRGEAPRWWRTASHWEYDWRDLLIDESGSGWPWRRALERQQLAVTYTGTEAYVQFGSGPGFGLDVAADPSWNTTISDPARLLALAQRQLVWRAEHLDRRSTGIVLGKHPIGIDVSTPAES
jgi:arylsulfatase A-like enzyme